MRKSECFVKKSWLEICVSTGLVALMIVLVLAVAVAAPEGLRSTGYSLVMLLFMILMGVAGLRLIDMQ
jgi:hypothetical protein